MRSLAALLALILLNLVSAPRARAYEVVLQNDSTLAGTPSGVGNFFVVGESAASWLTSTCDGEIVAARIYWAAQIPGNPPSLEHSIRFFESGVHPTPGSLMTMFRIPR